MQQYQESMSIIIGGSSKIQYPPGAVWKLLCLPESLIGHIPNGRINPYQAVAVRPKSSLDVIFAAANVNNLYDIVDMYGVVLPENPEYALEYILGQLLDYILGQLLDYDDVFTRNPNLLPPPSITPNTNLLQLRILLRKYTTKELLDAYEYTGQLTNRLSLINRIVEEVGGAKLSWRHKFSQNDDTQNLEEFGRI